jgi:hypothetical protein
VDSLLTSSAVFDRIFNVKKYRRDVRISNEAAATRSLVSVKVGVHFTPCQDGRVKQFAAMIRPISTEPIISIIWANNSHKRRDLVMGNTRAGNGYRPKPKMSCPAEATASLGVDRYAIRIALTGYKEWLITSGSHSFRRGIQRPDLMLKLNDSEKT